jgi:hypothetical protein
MPHIPDLVQFGKVLNESAKFFPALAHNVDETLPLENVDIG